MTRTEPETRTPEMVKDMGPSASMTARAELAGPRACAERSMPRESNEVLAVQKDRKSKER